MSLKEEVKRFLAKYKNVNEVWISKEGLSRQVEHYKELLNKYRVSSVSDGNRDHNELDG